MGGEFQVWFKNITGYALGISDISWSVTVTATSEAEAVELAVERARVVNRELGLPPHGLSELAEIVHAVNVPVLAIGGITADNLESVLETGCAGIAVISAILADSDPERAATRLRAALDASIHQPRHSFPDSARRNPHAADRQPTTV